MAKHDIPIVKIAPIRDIKGDIHYMMEITASKTLLNEEAAEEYLEYLSEAIETMKLANRRETL